MTGPSWSDQLSAWSTFAIAVMTLVLVVAAIWAGVTAIVTLRASKQASEAAVASAEAARAANEQARLDSIEQTRPNVYVEILPGLSGTRLSTSGSATAARVPPATSHSVTPTGLRNSMRWGGRSVSYSRRLGPCHPHAAFVRCGVSEAPSRQALGEVAAQQEDAAAERAPEHPNGAWQGGGRAAQLAGRLYTSDPSSGIPRRLAPSRKQPITHRDQARTQSRDR